MEKKNEWGYRSFTWGSLVEMCWCSLKIQLALIPNYFLFIYSVCSETQTNQHVELDFLKCCYSVSKADEVTQPLVYSWLKVEECEKKKNAQRGSAVWVKMGGAEGLTRSAFVPDNEVFAAAGTLVRPEHAAVDKDLTAPSVLALVQHFLKRERVTRERGKTKERVRGRTISQRWLDQQQANLKPLQTGCLWPWEYGGEKQVQRKPHSTHFLAFFCFSSFIIFSRLYPRWAHSNTIPLWYWNPTRWRNDSMDFVHSPPPNWTWKEKDFVH